MTNSILQPFPDAAKVKELGKSIALSGMFGCQNEHQGIVLAWVIVRHGMNPLAIAQRYHIVSGKLSARSDWMLGALVTQGGTYRIIQRSPDGAVIELAYQGRTYRSELTWEQAQAESFGKGKNYSTPHKRMQMLWARVVSDGVRTIAPDIVTGVYTPEELADVGGIDIEAIPAVASTLHETPEADVPWQESSREGAESNQSEPLEIDATSEPEGDDDSEPVYEECLSDRISESEAAALRQYIAEVSQSVPGLAQAVKDRLTNAGCKLADLSKAAARDLRIAVESKELQAIAEAMLQPGELQPEVASSS